MSILVLMPRNSSGAARILTESQDKRLIVGVTGATGIVYAARALKVLRLNRIETHLIVSVQGK